MAHSLSPDHTLLLAVHYTSEANISALRTLPFGNPDALSVTTVLRILLTYLPESLDPPSYTPFLDGLVSGTLPPATDAVDPGPVAALSVAKARKRARNLPLLTLAHAACPASLCPDPLVQFLIHRAHRIDTETGLLPLITPLVEPFLARSEFLCTWYVSTVLPLLRLGYEYYPAEGVALALEQTEYVGADGGVGFLLRRAGEGGLARDLRGLAGPWVLGDGQRKRRRLNTGLKLEQGESEGTGHEWEAAFVWMVHNAVDRFPIVAEAIETWGGPADVDFGGYREGRYLDEELERRLQRRYVQTAFAAVFAAREASTATVGCAYRVLIRIADLMDAPRPRALDAHVDELPTGDVPLSQAPLGLEPAFLLERDAALTTPSADAFRLLQLLVFSAHLLMGLGHTVSIADAAKIRLCSTAEEQLSILQRILHVLSSSNRDDAEWIKIRSHLLWLRSWGSSAGLFTHISPTVLETELLKSFLATGHHTLVITTYIQPPTPPLPSATIETTIISSTLQTYDSASNGNRHRGALARASATLTSLRPFFPSSPPFARTEHLLAATHSLSFYSLSLPHGLPFRPVNIRASPDPIALLERLLSQNPGAYTRLDDLLSIGAHLAAAADPEIEGRGTERRVTAMAIEAALREDDFETAYSYVVNRLGVSPGATSDAEGKDADDLSWRAALAAGRHRAPPTSSAGPPSRRLEQRLELLSQALLLAPPSAVIEILTAWRKAEEELTALAAQDDDVNVRDTTGMPGGFMEAMVQPRREVGRGVEICSQDHRGIHRSTCAVPAFSHAH
ncbi:secretory pathway Sec39 [Trichodelitschia bisporula]|uniref:Secretory pathway Sec39 n=1 Tax=Trichodelitschia bisporula TaxID=703511 RepID=A0A6G1HWC0_9PEZI|nr:secretory pathway Sec39 [Trichodelitschia bisporula]